MKLLNLTRGLGRGAASVSRRALLSGFGAMAIVLPATAAMHYPPVSGGGGPPFDLAGEIGAYQGEIDPHLAPYNCKGDAVQGTNGTTNAGNKFTLDVYQFTAADIGKKLWVNAWNGSRTITGLVAGDPNSCTFDGNAVGAGSGRGFLFGTDDTAGFQAAIDAAQYSATGGYVGDATAGVGNKIFGRVVKMRSGRLYLISNSAASYNAGAGKIAALVMRRRTGIIGGGTAASGFCVAPGTYGFGIANEGATTTGQNNAYCDFMTAKSFSVFGWKGLGQPNMLDLFKWSVSFDYFDFTDSWNTIDDILLVESPRDGFYISGRGEFMVSRLRALFSAGYNMTLSTTDTAFVQLSSGGSSKGGIRVYGNPNTRLTNCKAWYSGKGGGTSVEDTCNWLVDADQAKNGITVFDNCEAQEARGSGWVVKSGYNVFRACRTQDAGQANMLDAGTLPTIRAGVYLLGQHCIENDFDMQIQAGVRIFKTPTFLGSHALYVDASAARNRGAIETMDLLTYAGRTTTGAVRDDGAKIGGAIANGLNTRLRIDGVALT